MVYASSEVCGVYGYVPGHEEWSMHHQKCAGCTGTYLDMRSGLCIIRSVRGVRTWTRGVVYASSEVCGVYGYVPGHEEWSMHHQKCAGCTYLDMRSGLCIIRSVRGVRVRPWT